MNIEESARLAANMVKRDLQNEDGVFDPGLLYDVVRHTPQELTEGQKAQARENIGALPKNFGVESAGAPLMVGDDGNVFAYGVEHVVEPVRIYENGSIYPVSSSGKLFVNHANYTGVRVYQVYAGNTYKFKGTSAISNTYTYALAQGVYDRPDSGYNTGMIYTVAQSEDPRVETHEYEIAPTADCYLYVQFGNIVAETDKKVFELQGVVENFNTEYKVLGDGSGIEIRYPYGDDTLIVLLDKRGGNNLFDFHKISTRHTTLFESVSSDWHSPFVVAAVNNADGDAPSNAYFTGGNHQTNNTGSGGAVTARTSSMQFYANGKTITAGKSGKAERIEMRWTNMVQGYNTSKADGSGREILQENHTLSFVNGKFESFVELIPLEDVIMSTYYGLQACTNSAWTNIRYLGGTNRAAYTGASESGDLTTYCVSCYDDMHKMLIEIDPTFDLGRRTDDFTSGTRGAFHTDYHKLYFTIINKPVSMTANSMYCLRGSYTFMPA
jgi:hypothetical protein